jgi:hypothetical protein
MQLDPEKKVWNVTLYDRLEDYEVTKSVKPLIVSVRNTSKCFGEVPVSLFRG